MYSYSVYIDDADILADTPTTYQSSPVFCCDPQNKKSPDAAQDAAANFIFSRFWGPAIACPQKYGISDEDLPPNVSRGLILASKLLQAMPSKREFREEFMQVCCIPPPRTRTSVFLRMRATCKRWEEQCHVP